MALPDKKPYTHVRLIEHKERIVRFEIRVSTFLEFDQNAGRRTVSGLPDRDHALRIAKEIANAKRAQSS